MKVLRLYKDQFVVVTQGEFHSLEDSIDLYMCDIDKLSTKVLEKDVVLFYACI